MEASRKAMTRFTIRKGQFDIWYVVDNANGGKEIMPTSGSRGEAERRVARMNAENKRTSTIDFAQWICMCGHKRCDHARGCMKCDCTTWRSISRQFVPDDEPPMETSRMTRFFVAVAVLVIFGLLYEPIEYSLRCPEVDDVTGDRCEKRRWHSLPHLNTRPPYHAWW